MSISHWGMFFGFMVAVDITGTRPGTYAAWQPCQPEEWISW